MSLDKNIKNIESALSLDDNIVTDTSMQWIKTVPENACPWIQLNYFGGASYSENNKLKHVDIESIYFRDWAYNEHNYILIPEVIRNLEGYGMGINDTYYNYIDFNTKEYVQRIRRVVVTGSENWYSTSTSTGTKRWQSNLPSDCVAVATN
jgi:hypothetical protein